MSKILPFILIIASVGLFFMYINPTYTGISASADNGGKSISELKTLESSYNDALTKTREIELVRNGLLAKYRSVSPNNLDRISKLLPPTIDSVRLIIDINGVAARYGMSLRDISVKSGASSEKGGSPAAPAGGAPSQPVVQPAAAGANYPGGIPGGGGSIGPQAITTTPIELGFSVTGSYGSFLQFLSQLEQSLRLIDIVSLSLKTVNIKNQSASAEAKGSAPVTPDLYDYSLTIQTYQLK